MVYGSFVGAGLVVMATGDMSQFTWVPNEVSLRNWMAEIQEWNVLYRLGYGYYCGYQEWRKVSYILVETRNAEVWLGDGLRCQEAFVPEGEESNNRYQVMVSWDQIAAQGYGIGRGAAEARPTPPDLFEPDVPPDRDEQSFLRGYYKGIQNRCLGGNH